MMRGEEEKAAFVRRMFARIAHRYDLMNRLMTLGRDLAWRQVAAELAALPPGGLALDMATGTADLAIALARQTPTSYTVGVDVSLPMMGLGRRKVEAAGLAERIVFVQGDGLALPFPDRAFDCAVSGFALRDVASIPQALTEVRRVVAPGGRVVLLELTRPTRAHPLFRRAFQLYFHRLVPPLGGWISGQPEAYGFLPESLDRFLSPEELKALMEEVGLGEIRYTLLAPGTAAVHVGVVSG
jgi:demethylmenaquinone methyltransferase/2-methoxy-6-polyprenyl-1,4-benzoquinol methylase